MAGKFFFLVKLSCRDKGYLTPLPDACMLVFSQQFMVDVLFLRSWDWSALFFAGGLEFSAISGSS